MSYSPELSFQPPPKRRLSWPDNWVKDQALRHVIRKMRRNSLSSLPTSELDEVLNPESDTSPPPSPPPDFTSLLSDELILSILSKLPESSQHISNSVVCKRWSRLSSRLVLSLKLLDWEFLESGRLVRRFPNLTSVNLIKACIRSSRNSGIVVTHKFISVHINSCISDEGFIRKKDVLNPSSIDRGLRILAEGCPNLRSLVIIGSSTQGLSYVAEQCDTLQELELHCCPDMALPGIVGCRNLQILKLIGSVDGFYYSTISDIGLTIVAQGCRRLVKLELVGCEGSYDGIKAIGQCCQMLEELTLHDHRMDGGWLAALSFCSNLKTLKLLSCKSIDSGPGPDEHLGLCPALYELHLQQCQIRDKEGLRALFLVCEAVRELYIHDCWGLEDSLFSLATIFRSVRFLSVQGCSLLTMEGLDAVVISWKELKRLRVVSCNNMKDSEMTPAVATLFCLLKELKWQPDTRSILLSGLEGTEMERKGGGGGRSFKRVV